MLVSYVLGIFDVLGITSAFFGARFHVFTRLRMLLLSLEVKLVILLIYISDRAASHGSSVCTILPYSLLPY